MDIKAFFDAHYALIELVIRTIAQRYYLQPDEVDDFRSAFHLKLIEDDTVLQNFEERCSLKTYLTVVATRLLLDMRNARWGKWRPCKAARRAGPVGILLDRLTSRDRYSFDQAYEILKTNHGVRSSRGELYRWFVTFPVRTGRRYLNDDALKEYPVPPPPDPVQTSVPDLSKIADDAVCAGLDKLSRLELFMFRACVVGCHPVAATARRLHREQKPLYRVIDKALRTIRYEFTVRGLDAGRLKEILDHPEIDLAECLRRWWRLRKRRRGPSEC